MRSHIKSSITSRPKMSYKATRVASTSNCKKSIYNNVSKIYSSKTSCHYKSFCAMFLDVTFKHSNRSAARRNVLRSVRPHDRPHVLQSNDHQTCRRAHCFGWAVSVSSVQTFHATPSHILQLYNCCLAMLVIYYFFIYTYCNSSGKCLFSRDIVRPGPVSGQLAGSHTARSWRYDIPLQQVSNSLGTVHLPRKRRKLSCIAWIHKQHQVMSIQAYRRGIFLSNKFWVLIQYANVPVMINFLEYVCNRLIDVTCVIVYHYHRRLASIKHFITQLR